MLFNLSQRKGIFILLLLLAGIIVIPRQLSPKTPQIFLLTAAEQILPDTPATKPHQQTHIPKHTPLELNRADSLDLIAIRGIGPYYASRILRYRERLGGFYSVLQLKELKMKYFNIDSCAHLFCADPSLIQRRSMDTMDFKSILKHPYLEYEDVQMIFNAKRKYDTVSYDILESKRVLPDYLLKKIKPYFK